MIKKIFLVYFLINVLFLSGCNVQPEVRKFIKKSQVIVLKKKQILNLELESNPTTGYSWVITRSLNKGVLEAKGDILYIRKSNAIGAGGCELYTAQAVKKGNAVLTFEYRRPWEKNSSPAKKFVIRVIVH